MQVKIISIGLVILLTGVLSLGCSAGQTNELKAQIAEQQAQIADLESEIKGIDNRIAELEKQNLERQKEVEDLEQPTSGTAEIEVTFRPSPVPCEDGYWEWQAVFSEANGIGVKLDNLTYARYGPHRPDIRDYDSSWIGKNMLPSAYLPAYGSAGFRARFPCQAVDYAIYTVTGVDDNGHEIKAVGRVDFLSP